MIVTLKNKLKIEAGERTCGKIITLPVDLGSIPSTRWQLTPVLTPALRGPEMYVVHNIQAREIHRIFLFNFIIQWERHSKYIYLDLKFSMT